VTVLAIVTLPRIVFSDLKRTVETESMKRDAPGCGGIDFWCFLRRFCDFAESGPSNRQTVIYRGVGPEGAKDFVESRDPAESSAERRNVATFQEIGALIRTSVNSGKISPQCIHRCFRSKSVR
jgi:hypothetical protein